MRKFAARGSALAAGPLELLARLVMCVLPVVTFEAQGFALAAVMAAFAGTINGYGTLWGSFTSRSFVADTKGLEITSGFRTQVVPWANVTAVQTWHHFNRIDYVAVHYFRTGRIAVATCLARYAEDELSAFARACATHACASAPRTRITIAGLSDQAVYLPLLKRMAQDAALATLAGVLIGAFGPAFLLGLLTASLAASIGAMRYSLRTITLVLEDGLWSLEGAATRPLRTIPRALRLWVRGLAEAAWLR